VELAEAEPAGEQRHLPAAVRRVAVLAQVDLAGLLDPGSPERGLGGTAPHQPDVALA